MPTEPPRANEIRGRLLARRAELSTRRQRVDDDLARKHEPLCADFDEQAIQLENDQTLSAIGEAARQEIGAIDEALERLDLGLYGICKRCAGPIAPGRLEAVPQAVVCTACVSN